MRPLDPAHVAPWVIAAVRAWPPSVEDRLIAIAVGVQLQHVRLARQAPASSLASRRGRAA